MRRTFWVIFIAVEIVLGAALGVWLIQPSQQRSVESIPAPIVTLTTSTAPVPPTAPAPVVVSSTTPVVNKGVSVLFVGDMMFDRTVATRIRKNGFEYPFAHVASSSDQLFDKNDIIVGNLEGPIAERVSSTKSISFAFDPRVVLVLKKMGFDAVSQANNHSLDQGRAGAEASRKALQDGGVIPFGDEVRDDASSSLAIIERDGKKIALIGLNATDAPVDQSVVTQTIATAKQRADLVVVFMHWGAEYHDKPIASQIDLAHWLIDHGVSAVIGSHPHWMESVEVYHGKIIAYSLGNFIFDQDWSTETNLGLVVGLTMRTAGEDLASSLFLYPIKIEQSQPRLLSGSERQSRLQKLAEESDSSLKDQILSGVVHSP
jgi:poly-gamma-glutamate synthesis protein (capsule biosynthesis protein)